MCKPVVWNAAFRAPGIGKSEKAAIACGFFGLADCRTGAYWNSFSAWVIVFDTPQTSGTST